MNEMFDVKDKVVVITGGAGVLCSTMARALAKAGAKVAVLDLNAEAAAEVAEEITKDAGKAIAVKCNVLDKESMVAARAEVKKAYGPVDILINGAGGNKKEATTSEEMPFFDMPADAIRFVFDLNFLGALLPTQVFARDMTDSGKGIILNVSSMNAFKPLTKIPAYSAAKAVPSILIDDVVNHRQIGYILS